jgi:NTE family protein
MQWIEEADGVFRGGGVKGIALAGALCGFAEHPTKPVKRWENVAGASAGAIIASYLALGHTADEMLDLLRNTNYGDFQDFPLGRKFFGGGPNLLLKHGLAHGDAFEEWFDGILGGATFEQVEKEPDGDKDCDWRLKLIAVDVTHRDLLVLPDDLHRYRLPGKSDRIEPSGFKIAKAARMSMSLPYFFEPVVLDHAKTGNAAVIIDGGILSNFPVWIFDVNPREAGRPPRRPTFGFTLVGGRSFGLNANLLAKLTPWPLEFAFEIFHTAQQAWDKRFVSQSTRVRTVEVDAADVGTTDFDLSDEKERHLVDNGRKAAREFLDEFELADYMNTFHAKLGEDDAVRSQAELTPTEARATGEELAAQGQRDRR